MKYTLYTAALACTTLLAASCGKEHTEDFVGEGCLQMSVELPAPDGTRSTRAGETPYDPAANGVLRIYNADNQLIRKYAPAEECPEYLYLIAGSYKAAYESSDGSIATWDHLSYAGEQSFEITAHATEHVTLTAPIRNAAVKVIFDPTIAEKMEAGFMAFVCVSDEFSYDDAYNGDVPTLRYEEDRTGFFLMPEGATKLNWGFYGVLKDTGEKIALSSKQGRAIVPEPGMLYSLRFQYSKTPDGGLTGITVQVEEEGEIVKRDIFFSPQPTFAGQGFSIGSIKGYTGSELKIDVSAIARLSKITLKDASQTHTLFENGTPASVDGLAYATTGDGTSGVITLSTAFLDRLAGGIHAFELTATDSEGETGKTTLRIARQGLVEVVAADCDLWHNRATLRAIVTDESASNVVIRYRETGAAVWDELKTAKGEDFAYTAEVTPEWSAKKNENNFDVYTLTKGIVADKSYEYQLVIGGSAAGTAGRFTTAATQTIPYGDMESSLSCFTTDNTNSASWGSGNIKNLVDELCTQQTFDGMGGAHCAKLQATNQLGMYLAAGNLFLGTFNRSGMNGTVAFGQPYEWQARPAALKLKLHATIGAVNYNNHKTFIAKGAQDQSTVYVAIVDWNTRHGVTSGTATPSGMWSAADGPDVVNEGKVLGYGILDIKESTPGSRMVETTIPILWYDREHKPTGKYSLVIACSTSTYGDYMNGCDKNTLYVDDFEWAY